MTRRLLWTVLAALVGGRRNLFAQGERPQDLDPLKVCADTHKLLFENDYLRVIEAKVPVGGYEPKHYHPPSLTVYMANYTVESKTYPEGKVSRGDRRFGTVSWADTTVHDVKNAGQTPTHSLRIEMKMQ